MAKGKKTGGRIAGVSKNKATLALEHRNNPLVKLSSERLRQILEGKLSCGVCKGSGETKYQAARGGEKFIPRTCESCYGSKLERLSPDLVARVALSVREEAYPKMKAVEHSNPDGSLAPKIWEMRIAKSPEAGK